MSGRRLEQTTPGKRRCNTSRVIAYGVLAVDASATYIVLGLCYMAIKAQYTGSLPYLTTLIGALQASTAVVLGAYFKKSTCENTKGGITYDAALGNVPDPGTSDL